MSDAIERQARLAALLFGAYLAFMCIGTRPWSNTLAMDSSGQTDALRQLAVFAITGVALVALLLERRREPLATAAFLALMAYAGFLLSSASWSDHPSFVIRRAGLFTLDAFALCVLADYLRRARLLVPTILGVMLAVLAIDLLSIVLLHGLSIDHEGRWKGIHEHKNEAGSVMAVVAIVCGWLAARRRLLWLPCLAASAFLAATGSKTSFALLFGSVGLTFAVAVGLRVLRAARGLRLLVLAALLPVLAASIDLGGMIQGAVGYLYGDVTFTGRVSIWDYVLAKHAEAPWLGHGFGSFWGMGDLTPAISEDVPHVREFGQAHNGYLDVLVQTGRVGMGLLAAMLGVVLAAGLRRVATAPGDWQTDAMFLNLVCFALLHNLLETTFLRSLGIVWALLVVSSVQLVAARGAPARLVPSAAPPAVPSVGPASGWQALHRGPT